MTVMVVVGHWNPGRKNPETTKTYRENDVFFSRLPLNNNLVLLHHFLLHTKDL